MRILALCLLMSMPCVWAAPVFEVQPATTVLEGEPLTIRLTNVPKGQPLTISATRVLNDLTPRGELLPVTYSARASFDVPDNAVVDLATALPRPGSSYRDADVRGLFWSMQPDTKKQAAGKQPASKPPKGVDTTLVTLTASIAGEQVATTHITLQRALPQVVVTAVPEFPGAIFASLGGERRPAVIVLGGSEGGSWFARDMSPRLASRGFAVLGLPYYSPGWGRPQEIPGLPATFVDIPVERLNAAFAWLQQRDDVDATRVALYGVSKGAEFSLLAATRFDWIKAAVAVVPSDVVWEGFGLDVKPGTTASFAVDGKALPFVPYQGMEQEFTRSMDVRIRRPSDAGRAAHPAAAVAARIPVENFKGPLLVIGGHDDQVWASGMMAQNIAERRAQAGLETENLVFLEAGHRLSGTGYEPIARYQRGIMNAGGTAEATARAQAVAFPRTMAFLRRALRVEE